MCGVCGFIRTGSQTVSTWPVVKEAYKGIEERGPHAAGYGSMGGGYIHAVKHHVTTSRMAEYVATRRRVEEADLFIGHSRWATDGDPKDNANNHPHYTDDLGLVLVHNGIVRDRPEGITMTSECDSEILLRLLERDGMDEGFQTIARLERSDYAVLVINKEDGAVYAFRNEGRPLVFANMTSEIGGYLIASTEAILRVAVANAGLFQPRRVVSTMPYRLYKFAPEKRVSSRDVTARPANWLDRSRDLWYNLS